MTALLLKDLRLLRPWWALIVAAYLLFAANGIVGPEVFFAVNVVLTLALTMVLLIVEWQRNADRFVGSLPVSRTQVVRARYAWALGAALGGTVVYALYGTAVLALATERLRARWPGSPGWGSAEGLATFFFVVWLVSVAYLPFYFRAGLGRGSWQFVVWGAPLVVVTTLLMRWGAARGLPLAWGVPGTTVCVLALLVLAGALGGASLALSIRFFERRDL